MITRESNSNKFDKKTPVRLLAPESHNTFLFITPP